MGGFGDDGRKKKITIISVSSLILVAMVIAVTVGVVVKKNGTSPPKAESGGTEEVSTSMKAVQAICQTTDFKQTCVDSLKQANTSDPKELIRAGFKAAMSKLSEAASRSVTLKELAKDPMASQALENCKEMMEFAIDDLQTSFEKMGEFDVTKLGSFVADLKIWLSATITYQETCLDGFQNTTGDAGEQMRKALATSSQLTSNALSMVSELSTVLSSFDISRHLLSDDTLVLGHGEFPNWLDQGRRKLLFAPAEKITPNVTIAKDGTGNFTTINEALPLIQKNRNETFVIYVKAGVYQEYVYFNKSMLNVMLIGDGPKLTKITGNKNWADGVQTYLTGTVIALGDNFMARDIGFENTAGAIKHQAVALRVQSDNAIFHNCQMDGYQDTLYVHTKRQYYRDCTISGTIDFIFGDAAAVFQNCTFVVRKPLDNQACIVTAQGRNTTKQPTGIVIQNSRFTAELDYYPVKAQNKAYLGRPWKEYSRTIIIESYIEDFIQPEGWLPWQGNFALNTLFYSEFKNRGPGSLKAARVKWPGIKRLSAQGVLEFTAGKFINGDSWIPATGVPYNSGLISQYPAGSKKKTES